MQGGPLREVLLLTKKDLIKIWLKKICVVVVMVTVPPSSSSSIIPLPPVVIVLTAISIVGAIAIPFGDPQFIDRAIALELSFITLAIVILLGDS